jgi:hypothetical protein
MITNEDWERYLIIASSDRLMMLLRDLQLEATILGQKIRAELEFRLKAETAYRASHPGYLYGRG